MKIRSHLVMLILGTLIPVFVFSAIMVVVFSRETRGASERGLVETARALSVAVDQQVLASVAVLQSLATSKHLRPGDLDEFKRGARAVLAVQSRWQTIVLFAPDGRQILDVAQRSGRTSSARTVPEPVVRILKSREPAVSDLFSGGLSDQPAVLAAVPVIRNGEVAYVLGAVFDPNALTDALLQQDIPSDAIGSLLDRHKIIIARTRAAERFVGQPGTPDLAAKMDETREGAFRLFTKEGQPVYAAVSRSPRTGWTVAVGAPAAAVEASLRSSLWLLLLVGGGSTLLGLLAAVVAARRIAGPITSLSAAAAALAEGKAIASARTAIAEVSDVIQAMEQAGQERRRQEAAGAALASVGRELTGTLDPVQVMNRIVSAVLEFFSARRAILYQVDDGADVLVCVATAGDGSAAGWLGQQMAKGAGASGRAFAEARVISSSDVMQDLDIAVPDWTGHRIREEGYRAVTSVPLKVREEVLGVLSLGYDAGRVLSEAEVRLLSTFADQAAVALENARLFKQSERRRGAAEALGEVGRLLSRSLDPAEVSQRIVDSLKTLLSASTSNLYRLDPVTGELCVLATAGLAATQADRPMVLPAGIGAAGLAVRERLGVITPDVLEDPRILITPEFRAWVKRAEYRAVLSVPMMIQGRVIGALGVGDRAGRLFDGEEIRIAQAFADQAAIAIENARLHGETRARLSQTETLLIVAQELSGTLDLGETMRRVARETGRALKADMVGTFLADADHTALHPIAGYHVPKHLLADFQTSAIPLKGHRILEEAWEKRQAVASSDVGADPRVDREAFKHFPHRSNIFCPMTVQGEAIGGLFVTWFEEPRQATPEELRLVEGISRQAGIALANTRLVDELKARQARLETLVEVGQELSRIQPREQLLTRIAEACGRLLEANSVGFRLVQGEDLVLCGTWGPAGDLMAAERLKIGESLSGAVVATGEPLVIWDPADDPRLAAARRESYRRFDVRAFLGIPIKIDDEVIGVLTVRTSRKEGFSDADVKMTRAFAAQAAIGLENSRLYQEVRHTLDELSKTQTQLVQAQKMEAVGQLAGGVAHDFNNILTVISGRSRLLLARLGAGAAERRDVDLIDKAADRAAALTRQLLAFSRKQVLQPKPLDLNALVGGLVPMLTRLIGEHIELVRRPGTDLGQVLTDPGQLEQVIMNLVVNARDAMPDGGTIKIETATCEAMAPITHAQGHVPPGRYVTLVVQDTGCGMSPETLTRIFEPFFTTKDPGKGTGLGLSTVYGIVHQSSGHIGVDSTVGQGTRFTIYLPRTAAAAETPGARESGRPLPKGRETVLVVEDDEQVRALASEVLKACGYSVLQTGSPREAVAIADRVRDGIALLITDMVMPGLNGPALAAQLLPLCPDLHIVYVSGYTHEMIGAPETLEPRGAFLQKPFTPDSLAQTVREVLDST